MDKLWENLETLKMKNTLKILGSYLERTIAENRNIVEVLDRSFLEEAKSKRRRAAYEKQFQMSSYINCRHLIEQMKKAYFENRRRTSS